MATVIALIAGSTFAYLYSKARVIDAEIDQYAYLKHTQPVDANVEFIHPNILEPPIPVGRLVYDTHSDERAYHTFAAHEDQKRANESRKGYSSFPWAGRPHTDAFKRIHPDRRSRIDWQRVEAWEDTKHAFEKEIADEELPNFTGTTAARTFKRQNIYISTVDPNRVKRWNGLPVEENIPY